MIKLLFKIEPIVEQILEEVPITRGSNHVLYSEYYRRINSEYYRKTHMTVNFDKFWENPHRYGGAMFSSVERYRRHIQGKRPELKDRKVAELREEAEMDCYNYAIGG